VGTTGDSYENALAESIIGLFKTEVNHRPSPWKSIGPAECATLEWVDRFNHRRLLGPIGDAPPAEFERAILCLSGRVSQSSLTHTKRYPEIPG